MDATAYRKEFESLASRSEPGNAAREGHEWSGLTSPREAGDWMRSALCTDWQGLCARLLHSLEESEAALAKLHAYCDEMERDNHELHELRDACQRKDTRIAQLQQRVDELEDNGLPDLDVSVVAHV